VDGVSFTVHPQGPAGRRQWRHTDTAGQLGGEPGTKKVRNVFQPHIEKFRLTTVCIGVVSDAAAAQFDARARAAGEAARLQLARRSACCAVLVELRTRPDEWIQWCGSMSAAGSHASCGALSRGRLASLPAARGDRRLRGAVSLSRAARSALSMR
jgi:hypothetical protein